MVTPESVLRATVNVFNQQYNDLLATTALEWAITEKVELSPVKAIEISATPTVLPPVWESPLMRVSSGQMRTASSGQQYLNRFGLDIHIFLYFRYVDARQMSLAVLRHMETMLRLFEINRSLGLGGRNAVDPNSLAMYPSDTSVAKGTLVQGLLVRFTFLFDGAGL